MTELESPIKSPSPENLKRDISTPYLLRKLKQTKYAHTMPSQKYDSEDSSSSTSSRYTVIVDVCACVRVCVRTTHACARVAG